MGRPLEIRHGGAETLAQSGHIDGLSVRCFLRGDMVEIWRRDCACAGECGCWELDRPRPATDADKAAFAIAARPGPPKPPAPEAPDDDAIRLAAEQAQSAPRWRRWGEDAA